MKQRSKALLFDMDGLIIDSEPYWRKAMIEVFNSVGFVATEEMCAATTGLRIDEVVNVWYDNKPWDNKSKKTVVHEIIEGVCHYIDIYGTAMKGFYDVMELIKHEDIRIGLASSSALVIIHSVLKKLNIQDAFHIIVSGEEVSHGKPHPAIFIEAAHRLHIAPNQCTVLEDSLFGLIAAKAAHMRCIVVPEEKNQTNDTFLLSDYKLQSLLDFRMQMLEY